MRIAFNITNKTGVRPDTGNAGQDFWRILEAIRRITGGMETDFHFVRNLWTGDQPVSRQVAVIAEPTRPALGPDFAGIFLHPYN